MHGSCFERGDYKTLGFKETLVQSDVGRSRGKGRVASIHRESEKRSSRKLGFRCREFPETAPALSLVASTDRSNYEPELRTRVLGPSHPVRTASSSQRPSARSLG